MTWCHGVFVIWQSDMITSRKLDSSLLSECQIYLLSPPSPPLSLMTPWYLFLFDHLLTPHSLSEYTCLWSGSVAGHSQAANCQPCVPVDHSALCPAATISHPKKPLLLPPPTAFSIQQSRVWSQDRCPLYKLGPCWPCPAAGHRSPWNFTFLAPRSVKM